MTKKSECRRRYRALSRTSSPGGRKIGFHTFRHTYRAWLDETGAPVGVQQKLMRHAHVSTTMDQYGNASALAKRKANRPIVQRLLQRPGNQEVSIQ
ncbi:MAG: tyrosine-type recombinase/integrase [Candidatus Sulfotelmatobacter sp.]